MAKAVYVGVGSKARKMKKAYVGIGGKARKVKKMYIGDSSGKARLCYSAELEYVGTATALSCGRVWMAGTSVGSYAMFAGGQNDSSCFDTVEAYNASRTKIAAAALRGPRAGLAAASNGSYAFFAGGKEAPKSDGNRTVDAYNSSLTRTAAASLPNGISLKLGGTRVGSYAVFAGGQPLYDDDMRLAYVTAYDSALTCTAAPELARERSLVKGVTLGNYALFAGGDSGNIFSGNGGSLSTVDVYDSSLTHTTAADLSNSDSMYLYLSGAVAGSYAIFTNKSTSCDIYNASLTKTTATLLSTRREGVTGASVGEYAVFAGGISPMLSTIVDVCDASLTRISTTGLSVARREPTAATVGDTLLFAGGWDSTIHYGTYNTVDVYTA